MKIIELDEGIFDRVTNWFRGQDQNASTNQPAVSNQSTNQPAQQDQATRPKTVKYEPGARGPIIADLQKVLAALGYEQQVGTPDGVFGSGTIKAIAQFQADQNLPKQTGVVDQATITKLNQLNETCSCRTFRWCRFKCCCLSFKGARLRSNRSFYEKLAR